MMHALQFACSSLLRRLRGGPDRRRGGLLSLLACTAMSAGTLLSAGTVLSAGTTLLVGTAAAQDVTPAANSNQAQAPQYQRVLMFDIKGEINGMTTGSVERYLGIASERNADLVIFQMDTLGGEVTAALDVSKLLKNSPIKTVMWVNTQAISAGALISLAADEIVINSTGLIGDCAPILMGGTLEGVEREKTESLLRAEFRDSALRHGYSPELAQAMVTRSSGIYHVVRKSDESDRRYVDAKTMKVLTGAEEPSAGTPVAEDERGAFRVVRQVLAEGQLLTMVASEALDLGFAKATADNLDELRSMYPSASFEHIEPTLSESLAAYLGSIAVRGVLTGLFVLCLYVAFQTPGQGWPEILALVTLGLLIVPPYLAGMANWLEIGMIFLGLTLIAVEIFVLPGMGIAGISGLLLLLAGLVLSSLYSMPDSFMPIPTPGSTDLFGSILEAFGSIILAIAAGLIGGMLLLANASKLPGFSKLVPANPDLSPAALAEQQFAGGFREVDAAVGDRGTADTDLRPIGRAKIHDRIVTAQTQGQYVARGSAVRVIAIDGPTVIVEAMES